MRTIFRCLFFSLLILILTRGDLIASQSGYGWHSICVLDKQNPDISISAFSSKKANGDYTKIFIQSDDIRTTIEHYKSTISIKNIKTLSYFAGNLLDVATYKYLTNQTDDLNLILDYSYEVITSPIFLRILDKPLGYIDENNEQDRVIKTFILEHLKRFSRLGELYYHHWEISNDPRSLDMAIKVFLQLRVFLPIHKNMLKYRHSEKIFTAKIYTDNLLPSSLEYFFWENSAYMELAMAQKAVIQGDLNGLEKIQNDFWRLSTYVEKEIMASMPYADDVKFTHYPNVLQKSEELSAYKYMLFEKPLREIFLQRSMLNYIQANFTNQHQELKKISRKLWQHYYKYMNAQRIEKECDRFFLTKIFNLRGEIGKTLVSSIPKAELKKNYRLYYTAIGDYREAMSLANYEISPVLWLRSMRGLIEMMKILAEEDEDFKIEIRILEDLYRDRK